MERTKIAEKRLRSLYFFGSSIETNNKIRTLNNKRKEEGEDQMPNDFKIPSNDTENGYIYKELNNRMSRAEQLVRDLTNLMGQLNALGVSAEDVTGIMSALNRKAEVQYVQNHVEDGVRHLNDVKVMEWDSKYEMPLDGIPEDDLHSDVRRKLNAGGGTGEGDLSGILKFATPIGDGSTRTFSFRHSLNTRAIQVSVWEADSGDMVYPDIEVVNENSVRVSFLQAPRQNQYTLVVIG
jgi:hypothetical protein